MQLTKDPAAVKVKLNSFTPFSPVVEANFLGVSE